jgi:hypothetical protein
VFVFVERLNDGEIFPVWSHEVYFGGEWNDIYVEIVLPFGEYKVGLTTFIFMILPIPKFIPSPLE